MNDFYNQNTYDNHIKYDHIFQQQSPVEVVDCLIMEPSDETLDTFDSDDLSQ